MKKKKKPTKGAELSTPLKQMSRTITRFAHTVYKDIGIEYHFHAPDHVLVVYSFENSFQGLSLAAISAVARTQVKIGSLVEIIQHDRVCDGSFALTIAIMMHGTLFGDIVKLDEAYLDDLIKKAGGVATPSVVP